MAEPDFFRKIGWIGVIGPGFQQQHGSLRIRGQSTGQHTSSRSPADDHYVILHELSFTDIPRILGPRYLSSRLFSAVATRGTHAKCSWQESRELPASRHRDASRSR